MHVQMFMHRHLRMQGLLSHDRGGDAAPHPGGGTDVTQGDGMGER
jgi:hypothetical protein